MPEDHIVFLAHARDILFEIKNPTQYQTKRAELLNQASQLFGTQLAAEIDDAIPDAPNATVAA